MAKTQDRHPAIMTKRSVLARSGVYVYSYDDMVNRGMTPKIKKAQYLEYRPAEVLIRCKDKFAFTVLTVEHTEDETTPENFGRQTDGVVGDTITTGLLPDGETAIYGNIAFYTKDGVDYFNSGVRETSADYRSKVVPSKNSAYDFELVDILSVNGVALTQKGRGGASVRVMDSIKTAGNISGGLKMKRGILSVFGIGRSADAADFKISAVVAEHVKKIYEVNTKAGRTEDSVQKAIDTGVEALMSHIGTLTDRDEKEYLIGAVTDSLSHPVEFTANKEEASKVIDALYAKCRTADAEDFKKTLDAAGGKAEETEEEKAARVKKEAEEGGDKTKDTSAKLTEAIEKFNRATDSIPALIEAGITKRIGLVETAEQKAEREKAGRSNDTLQTLVDRSVQIALGVKVEDDKGGADDSRSLDTAGVDLDEASFLDHL